MNSKLSRALTLAVTAGMFASSVPVYAASELTMEKIGSYDCGQTNADGGVMEIVAYNKANGYAYAVNGQSGKLAIIKITDDEVLKADELDVSSIVEDYDRNFTYGDMTSVAVSPSGDRIAIAIQAEGYADNGRAAIFNCNDDGSIKLYKIVETGVQPDMITFYDENTVLTADEGEPRLGYAEGTTDPKGSVTIVNIKKGTGTTVDFTGFDNKRDELVENNIVLKKDTAPSVDLEPEYIAVADGMAYVTLQEANAIAVLDVENKEFTGIYSCGFEDYSEVKVDIDKKDEKYDPKTYESLRGIRMPDGITTFTADGTTYLVTANEGDSREWGDYLNVNELNFGKKGKTSPTGKITAENSGLSGKAVFFDTSDYDGLDSENLDYLFGGRTFTIYKVTDDGIDEVFSSEDDFERITADLLPDYFNCSNDDMTIDDRSGKKGPEPESVTVGKADGKTYAFVALERIGGIMAYDISDPENAEFAGYINSREFTSDIAGDVAPEGLAYISAKDSPNGRNLLLAACEVSGTVAVYAISDEVYEPEDNKEDNKSSGSSYSLENTTGKTSYCKVEFDTDGGSDIRSIRVKKNTALEDIDIPVKDGYIFGGWYTDKDCTKEFAADTKIKSDMTLYAKWIKDVS
ncbi:MAG: choice-of-anchor I family protein [Clostridia bacterium]|nr:choice-of-anchor I family protein [Clostridia bacterium]